MSRASAALRREVRLRAGRRCEYCRLPEGQTLYTFHVEHIIAMQHGGLTEPANLAWACLECNAAKGPNIATFDPETGELIRLYNPRQQAWDDHFEIAKGEIIGKTSIGRATAFLLTFNTEERIAIRRELLESDQW